MNQPAASLPIFRAGTHTSVDGRVISFSAQALQEMADGYDASLSEAPLVVGHPQLDAPAYGWAKSLRTDGDVLYAEPHQVDAQFAELVNQGRFKKISSTIYLPDSPGNPTPGKHYLRHIGFLGAAAPAVKGLKSAQFAAADGAVEFAAPLGYLGSTLVDLFQRLRDWFIEREGAEAADRIIPQWSIRSIDDAADASPVPAFAAPASYPEITMEKDATALAQREQEINSRETNLATREQALQAREAGARRADAAAFAEGLVKAGKLLPREQAPVVELLLAMPVDTSVSFAEGSGQVTKSVGEVLRQVLTDRPVKLDFSEKSPDEVGRQAASFAAPGGLPVDAARLELHQKAKAYQAEHPTVGYLDAVRAVSVG